MGSIELKHSTLGKRTTTQRKLLLELILEAGGHLDADELYRRAREREGTISLSTVYRNLKLFKEMGLVEERHFSEEHHHYEVKADLEHHHLVCLGCGKVIEFTSPLAKQMKQHVEAENGFIITDTEISMRGYCTDCWNRMTGEQYTTEK
ncbi:MAG: transcriptional repressor [Chloroflexota bacterium]|nr:transcriptional repressor [Chloroflexota bacterium]